MIQAGDSKRTKGTASYVLGVLKLGKIANLGREGKINRSCNVINFYSVEWYFIYQELGSASTF